ncbi:hypothetical protein [Pseudanabaena sp. 'Roaring Creek']|uniref:hypothetical protein n=1 Tax=Pseudanabaena sp. 'Roaring Creek' TaxID=1681830 RepID=UPI0012E25234|nr:hypothetical protein [Pseudanabaena sp. 'Roaring Creek']
MLTHCYQKLKRSPFELCDRDRPSRLTQKKAIANLAIASLCLFLLSIPHCQ